MVENATDYQFVLPEEILDNNPTLNLQNKRQSVNDLLKENGHAYEYHGEKKKVFGD